MSETSEPDSLRQHSARSEWKFMLGLALALIAIAIGMLFFLESKNWVIKPFGKYIELQILPLSIAAIILGIIWSIRALLGIRRCTDEIPMAEKEYLLLESINDLIKDRITRYSVAIILATIAASLNATHGAPDTIKISFFTEWLPALLYICAGIYAFELLILGMALALAGLLIWGITSLPTSLAIIIGAVIIAFAIYAHKK